MSICTHHKIIRFNYRWMNNRSKLLNLLIWSPRIMKSIADVSLMLSSAWLLVATTIHRLNFRWIGHINGSPSVLIIISGWILVINLIWVKYSCILIIIRHFCVSGTWVCSPTSVIGGSMCADNSILRILWTTTIRPIWIMLNCIVCTKLGPMCHIHLIFHVVFTTGCHLALVSHVVTSDHRALWRWRLLVFTNVRISAKILLVTSICSISDRSSRHFAVSRLLTCTRNLINVIFVSILSNILCFNIFNILLYICSMIYSLQLWSHITNHFYWRSYNAVLSLINRGLCRWRSTGFVTTHFVSFHVVGHCGSGGGLDMDGLVFSLGAMRFIRIWILHAFFGIWFWSVVLILGS